MVVQVPPRFELGLLDSESRVLTVTPRNRSISLTDEMHKIDRSARRSAAGVASNRSPTTDDAWTPVERARHSYDVTCVVVTIKRCC
jgi:hypothetical protein